TGKRASAAPCKCANEYGFGDSRHVFQEHVATAQHGTQSHLNYLGLAHHDGFDILHDFLDDRSKIRHGYPFLRRTIGASYPAWHDRATVIYRITAFLRAWAG